MLTMLVLSCFILNLKTELPHAEKHWKILLENLNVFFKEFFKVMIYQGGFL